MGHDGATAVEYAVQIDVEHPPPPVEGLVLKRQGRARDAGGAEQKINPAEGGARCAAAAVTASASVTSTCTLWLAPVAPSRRRTDRSAARRYEVRTLQNDSFTASVTTDCAEVIAI